MLQKKICMLGAFSVGKTSLVQQFVASIFDDKYLTTVGVKIDKKIVSTVEQDVTLMLWDLAGEDAYNSIKASYLRGASGCIVVVDGTRPKTLEVGNDIINLVKDSVGDVPIIVALNKSDLKDEWFLDETQLRELCDLHTTVETSAKNGQNVETMFQQLTERML